MDREVLIVDDDQRNIFALSAVLRARGYTCHQAGGGREALEKILKSPGIEIVLMDMMMPGMDGYEAIPFIKQQPGLEKLTIFAITAQAMAGDREKCLAAGADEYISKPVNIDILQTLLNKYPDASR